MTRWEPTNDSAGPSALLSPADSEGELSLERLPMLAPGPLPAIDQAALGEILADSLFGEVIELSDLVPHLLAPGEQLADPQPFVESVDMAGDAFVAMTPFSILFEEDGSSGHGTL